VRIELDQGLYSTDFVHLMLSYHSSLERLAPYLFGLGGP
jgi:hypothetical protein